MYIYWADQKVQSGFLVRYYIPTHLPIIPGVGGKEKTKLLVTMTIYYRCRDTDKGKGDSESHPGINPVGKQ